MWAFAVVAALSLSAAGITIGLVALFVHVFWPAQTDEYWDDPPEGIRDDEA